MPLVVWDCDRCATGFGVPSHIPTLVCQRIDASITSAEPLSAYVPLGTRASRAESLNVGRGVTLIRRGRDQRETCWTRQSVCYSDGCRHWHHLVIRRPDCGRRNTAGHHGRGRVISEAITRRGSVSRLVGTRSCQAPTGRVRSRITTGS